MYKLPKDVRYWVDYAEQEHHGPVFTETRLWVMQTGKCHKGKVQSAMRVYYLGS